MFSVIIPAYNCEDTIEDVLNSVINQTRIDLIDEIIIINDGSKDNTDNIIQKYILTHENMNFKYEYQRNQGVSVARNRGIMKSNSKWIALLDSDDLWKPNKMEVQYAYIGKDNNIKFMGSMYPLRILFKEKHGLYKLNAKELCIRNMPTTPSIVFERETGIEFGLFNETMRYGEDLDFYQKFLLIDSYYVLAEDLVDISYNKTYFAAKGLSSNLYEMHKGRNANTKNLYKMNLIGFWFMCCMLFCNSLKYLRRNVENKLNRINKD